MTLPLSPPAVIDVKIYAVKDVFTSNSREMLTRAITFLILGLLVSASAATAEPRDAATRKRLEKYWKVTGGTWPQTFRAAASIRVDQPIGEFEAYVLTMAYFGVHLGLCGGPELPKDRGDRWVSDTAVGYGGIPGPKIIVEKKTGLTFSPGLPKVRNPKEYLKAIRAYGW